MVQTIFITGTDTGVGKTVLTALLVKFLRGQEINAAALKPICSGGRDDARKISEVQSLSLGEINPFYFRAPIAPLLAARMEKRKVKLSEVIVHVRKMQKQFDFLIVEGAGGLLSPLGENFNSRDLILKLRAIPIVVAPNKLGVINQILLTLEALPENFRRKAKIVLVSPQKTDSVTASNAKLLAEFFAAKRIFQLPWFSSKVETQQALKNSGVRQMLRKMLQT